MMKSSVHGDSYWERSLVIDGENTIDEESVSMESLNLEPFSVERFCAGKPVCDGFSDDMAGAMERLKKVCSVALTQDIIEQYKMCAADPKKRKNYVKRLALDALQEMVEFFIDYEKDTAHALTFSYLWARIEKAKTMNPVHQRKVVDRIHDALEKYGTIELMKESVIIAQEKAKETMFLLNEKEIKNYSTEKAQASLRAMGELRNEIEAREKLEAMKFTDSIQKKRFGEYSQDIKSSLDIAGIVDPELGTEDGVCPNEENDNELNRFKAELRKIQKGDIVSIGWKPPLTKWRPTTTEYSFFSLLRIEDIKRSAVKYDTMLEKIRDACEDETEAFSQAAEMILYNMKFLLNMKVLVTTLDTGIPEIGYSIITKILQSTTTWERENIRRFMDHIRKNDTKMNEILMLFLHSTNGCSSSDPKVSQAAYDVCSWLWGTLVHDEKSERLYKKAMLASKNSITALCDNLNTTIKDLHSRKEKMYQEMHEVIKNIHKESTMIAHEDDPIERKKIRNTREKWKWQLFSLQEACWHIEKTILRCREKHHIFSKVLKEKNDSKTNSHETWHSCSVEDTKNVSWKKEHLDHLSEEEKDEIFQRSHADMEKNSDPHEKKLSY